MAVIHCEANRILFNSEEITNVTTVFGAPTPEAARKVIEERLPPKLQAGAASYCSDNCRQHDGSLLCSAKLMGNREVAHQIAFNVLISGIQDGSIFEDNSPTPPETPPTL